MNPGDVADDLIYNSGNTFSIPLFLYKIELGSSIHPEHIEIFHRGSHDGLREFWQNRGSDLDVNKITDYDPYLGRTSEAQPQPEQSQG